MRRAVLFIDDEPNVLSAFERQFRRDYRVETVTNGIDGLAALIRSGPFHVLLSDMRMPRMGGTEFLARAREVAPDAVRVMLTGEPDLTAAIDAVNEGAVFRFLLKPCAEPVLRKTLADAVQQYELRHAERELLERTLRGAMSVITDVLGLVSPEAFGRSLRVRRYVKHVAETLEFGNEWQFDLAAMLCQLGDVLMPLDAAASADLEAELPPGNEWRRLQLRAAMAHDLLVRVPRLEQVAAMIGRQYDPVDPTSARTDVTSLGARLLRVCVAFDERIAAGQSPGAAIAALVAQPGHFDPDIVGALSHMPFVGTPHEARFVPVEQLAIGMVVDQDVRTDNGMLVAKRGQGATAAMLARVGAYCQTGALSGTVRVLTAVEQTTMPPSPSPDAGGRPGWSRPLSPPGSPGSRTASQWLPSPAGGAAADDAGHVLQCADGHPSRSETPSS